VKSLARPNLLLDVVKNQDALLVPVAQINQDLRFEEKNVDPQHLQRENHPKNQGTGPNRLEGKKVQIDEGEIGGIQVRAQDPGLHAEEGANLLEIGEIDDDLDRTRTGIRFLREVVKKRQVK